MGEEENETLEKVAYVFHDSHLESEGTEGFPDCAKTEYLQKYGLQIPEHVAKGIRASQRKYGTGTRDYNEFRSQEKAVDGKRISRRTLALVPIGTSPPIARHHPYQSHDASTQRTH